LPSSRQLRHALLEPDLSRRGRRAGRALFRAGAALHYPPRAGGAAGFSLTTSRAEFSGWGAEVSANRGDRDRRTDPLELIHLFTFHGAGWPGTPSRASIGNEGWSMSITRKIGACLILAVVATLVAAPGVRAQSGRDSLDWHQRYLGILPLVKPNPSDPIVAKVNGTPITLAEVDSYARTEARMVNATTTEENKRVWHDAVDNLIS